MNAHAILATHQSSAFPETSSFRSAVDGAINIKVGCSKRRFLQLQWDRAGLFSISPDGVFGWWTWYNITGCAWNLSSCNP
jgi:hypothetical protein